jgi:hypothetical protein
MLNSARATVLLAALIAAAAPAAAVNVSTPMIERVSNAVHALEKNFLPQVEHIREEEATLEREMEHLDSAVADAVAKEEGGEGGSDADSNTCASCMEARFKQFGVRGARRRLLEALGCSDGDDDCEQGKAFLDKLMKAVILPNPDEIPANGKKVTCQDVFSDGDGECKGGTPKVENENPLTYPARDDSDDVFTRDQSVSEFLSLHADVSTEQLYKALEDGLYKGSNETNGWMRKNDNFANWEGTFQFVKEAIEEKGGAKEWDEGKVTSLTV